MKASTASQILVLLLALNAPLARPSKAGDFDSGRRSRSYSDHDSKSMLYSLSVAGGVSAPSSSGFRGENPAGLIYNQSASLLGYLATDKDHPESLSNGLSFMAGNGLAGATLGIQSFNNSSDPSGALTYLNFGMATYAEPLNLTLGISGSYRFQKAGDAPPPSQQATWTADFGLLFNPFGSVQLGLELYELSKGLTAAAAGVAAHINSFSLIGLDVSTDNHGRGLTLKPGLGVRAAALSMTYGYGMQINADGTSGITPGNTIGIGYEFSPQFRMQGYYNHFATYFLGATIRTGPL